MTKNRPPTRKSTTGGNPQNSFLDIGASDRYGRPQRNLRPVLLGALMGAVVATVLLIAYLLGANSRSNTRGGQAVVTPPTNTNAGIPTIDVGTDNQASSGSETSVPDDAPRIALQDFKKRYDDPAKRPVIIDVRQKADYEQGHIKGAISFPQDQVDNRVGELPKDKLIIAYCDWVDEEDSARVAQTLHYNYNFSYDNVKALLGGWVAWQDENDKNPNAYPIETGSGGG